MDFSNINYSFPIYQLIYPQFSYLSYNPTQLYYTHFFVTNEHLNIPIEAKRECNDQDFRAQSITLIENEAKTQKTQNQKKKPNKRREDGIYINKCQKNDRNLNSIVLRNFSNFLNNHPQMINIVGKIIDQNNLNIKAKQYCQMFKTHLPPRKSYVGVGKLKKFIERGKQKTQIKLITLILLRKFISTDFFTVIINSKKVIQSAKEKELKHGKKFLKELLRGLL